MSQEFKVGMTVMLREDRIDGLLLAFAKKIRDRTGLVEAVYLPIYGYETRIRVRWLRRGGRGKEFIEVHKERDLIEVAP